MHRWVDAHELPQAIWTHRARLAVLQLTHVDYKSGRIHDMAGLTTHAQMHGAQVLWDLAHTAGAMPVALDALRVDFAVGCGYKYLNGGPGAPAFAYVARRHLATLKQPLVGWHGHARPFAFEEDWQPAPGIERLLCGTAPQLSLLALETALDAFDGVDLDLLRAKSMALTSIFIEQLESAAAFEADDGLALASPRVAQERGSQVALRHPQAYAIVQALSDRGVIGDFREPDLMVDDNYLGRSTTTILAGLSLRWAGCGGGATVSLLVDDNYLGRSTTTILAGLSLRWAGCGGGATVSLSRTDRRRAGCPARRSRTTKCANTNRIARRSRRLRLPPELASASAAPDV